VRLWFPAVKAQTQITFELGKTSVKQTVAEGTKETTLPGVKLEAGPGQLQVTLEGGMERTGPTHVELTRE
jgi:hypothetical protein